MRREYWGVCDMSMTAHETFQVGTSRLWDVGVTWREIELVPGVYTWDRLDSFVEYAAQHGIELIYVLGNSPDWVGSDGDRAATPDPDVFEGWVRAVMTRYAGRIDAYQVWNEPCDPQFYKGTPEELGVLSVRTRLVQQELDSQSVLLAPSVPFRERFQLRWLLEWSGGAHVLDSFDAWALSMYPATDGGTPEDAFGPLLLNARQKVLGFTRPIWATEINYGVTGPPVAVALPDGEQVSQVMRTYLLGMGAGIKRVCWYRWDNRAHIFNTEMTLLGTTTVTPAGRAVAIVQGWMDGRYVSHRTYPGGTHQVVIRRPEGRRYVYWNMTSSGRVALPDRAHTRTNKDGRSRDVSGRSHMWLGQGDVVMVEVAA